MSIKLRNWGRTPQVCREERPEVRQTQLSQVSCIVNVDVVHPRFENRDAYVITITAASSAGTAQQAFTLTT
jgi:hypothetical protein